MKKTRFEAFSDGVLAIIITIMVLEIRVPHGERFSDLKGLIPILLSYALSFIYVGIYWNNHHHMVSTIKNVTGGILWGMDRSKPFCGCSYVPIWFCSLNGGGGLLHFTKPHH